MDDFVKSVEKFLKGKMLGSYSAQAVNDQILVYQK
jgi:hypothetical protein